jgi:hypothetical protein
MAWWWKRDSTMVKTRWYKRETTIVRWWNNDVTIVKQRWHIDENVIVRWWKCDGSMMKLRWHYDKNAILFSSSCRRLIVITPSCHHCFIIVPSYFHHRPIALEITSVPSCKAVSGKQKIVTEHCKRAIFERYNSVTRFASRRNLASRFLISL